MTVWPRNLDAGYNYAHLALQVGKPDIAIGLFQACLSFQSDYVPAMLDLAAVLLQVGRNTEALEVFEKIRNARLTVKQSQFFGHLLLAGNQTDSARSTLKKSYDQQPGGFILACEAALSTQLYCDSDEACQNEQEAYRQGLSWLENKVFNEPAAKLGWNSFDLRWEPTVDLEFRQRFGMIVKKALKSEVVLTERVQRRKKITMVGSVFTDTRLGHCFASWIIPLVNAGFEVEIIHLGPQNDIYTAQWIENASSGHIVDDVEQLESRLKESGADIVVYPELGYDSRLIPLAAQRYARQQVVAWGYPLTTGLDSIDYYFTCQEFGGGSEKEAYSEKLVSLKGLCLGSDVREVNAGVNRKAFGLSDEDVLLLIPDALQDIHVDSISLWVEVFERVKNACFVVIEDDSSHVTQAFLKQLHSRVDASRVRVFKKLPRPHQKGLYALCDVMLDTLYCNDACLCNEVLKSGVPVVTLPGQAMRSRQSAAVLEAYQIAEGVAENEFEFVEKVVALVEQSEKRHEYLKLIENSNAVSNSFAEFSDDLVGCFNKVFEDF
ncbi:MAG: O-linked N-acetylglucosamine transferase family protein [bacterium]